MNYYYKKKSRFKAFIWLLVIFMIGWSAAYFYYDVDETFSDSDSHTIDFLNSENSEPADLELFWDVWAMLDETYVDVTLLDDEEMVYGAIEGMVEALGDSYTAFMDPEETSQFHSNLDGELEGIGAELTVEDGELVIIAPIKDTPAEEAGLLPGDIIYLIDGERANEMTIWDAVMAIRGEKGTTVELAIAREGEDDFLVFEIVRAKVEIESVEWELIGDIAHISINQFADNTTDEFNEAVSEVLLYDVSGVVLDVRNNGGGYLDTAVDVLSDFLDGKDYAVIVKMREDEDNEIHYTSGSSRLVGLPLVVLVNTGSASASEIVAGSIQDHEVGIVIGDETFGKGSVQKLESLSDGSSLRLTIAKWYTPENRSIDDVGILPDILLEDDLETEADEQLDEAVSYLEGL